MIRFSALGAPDLRREEASELRAVLTQPRLLALLTYLVTARPGGFHRRDSLVALFWPEVTHEQARNALRQVVHRLRRALGDDVVVGRGVEELGVDPGRVWCDVVAFEQAMDAGQLEQALEMYRGDLLPGFHLSDAPEFERWLDEERMRLRQRASSGAWHLAEVEAQAGRAVTATEMARRASILSGDDEPAVQRHIALLLRIGDRAGALRAYDAFARRLREGLDIEPSGETQALVKTIQARTSPPSSPTVDPVRGPLEAPISAVTPIAVAAPETLRRMGAWYRSRWLIRGASLALTIGIATVGMTAHTRATRSSTTSVRTLAVLPFVMHGSRNLAYLGEGMVDLLSAKMNGTLRFRAIDPRGIVSASRPAASFSGDIQQNVAIARSLGAEWLLTGDIVEIAGRLQVTGTLYDVTGATGARAVTTASVDGAATSLFELVDDLAGRLLAGVAVGRDTSLVRLSALTTRSLSALEAFLDGEQALRAGQDAKATAAFREAASIDTTFALAQYRLALSSTWATTVSDTSMNPTLWASRAARNAARLTPLVRDLLEGYRVYNASNADEAERRYRAIVAQYPDNVEAWFMLGETHFHYNLLRGRSPDEARTAFARVLSLDPSNAHTIVHLARLAARGARADELDSLASSYADFHSDADRLLEIRALRAYLSDDPHERAEVLRQALSADDLVRNSVLEAALLYAQNFDATSDFVSLSKAWGRDTLIHQYDLMGLTTLSLSRGQFDRRAIDALLGELALPDWLLETEALVVADPFFRAPSALVSALRDSLTSAPFRMTPYPAVEVVSDSVFAPDVGNYLIGLLDVRLGDVAAAGGRLVALRAVTSAPRAELDSALAAGLEAEILRARGDAKGALAALDRFPSRHHLFRRFPHATTHDRFLRAELLHALGRDREALAWYESLGTMYDLPYIAPAHFRCAEIYERLGEHEAAALHYSRFARMWAHASPDLQPLVQRAQRAIAH